MKSNKHYDIGGEDGLFESVACHRTAMNLRCCDRIVCCPCEALLAVRTPVDAMGRLSLDERR